MNMPTTTGEVTGIVAIIGTVFSFLGVTGVDSGMISNVVTGLIALVTIVAAIHSYYTRPATPTA